MFDFLYYLSPFESNMIYDLKLNYVNADFMESNVLSLVYHFFLGKLFFRAIPYYSLAQLSQWLLKFSSSFSIFSLELCCSTEPSEQV